MTEQVLRGVPAAGGIAVATVIVRPDVELVLSMTSGSAAEQERALLALARIANDLKLWAALARREARVEEAEILEANRLIAEDPALRDAVESLALELGAERAVVQATETYAHALEKLADVQLAARGADIRALGRRAARILAGTGTPDPLRGAVIVVARDIGPADLVELGLGESKLLGIALAEGAATSHAAIMARALGVPLVVGLGTGVLAIADGEVVVLDGDNGTLVRSPTEATQHHAEEIADRDTRARKPLRRLRRLPCTTVDGRRVKLRCNAAWVRDISDGLEAGAEGVGLLRTELAHLRSTCWPSEADHAAALRPLLGRLEGKLATVRTLDFGADKTPPFLAGTSERGLALTLAHPSAFSDQLRAILDTGRGTRLRVLLPFVRDVDEVLAAKRLLSAATEAVVWRGQPPELGAMVETPEAVEWVDAIGAHVDFISIGTNDLVRYTLGLDEARTASSLEAIVDPRVLSLIGHVVVVAHDRRIPVEVCGEAAGEPTATVLLVGLGVDGLSVSSQRIDLVRWVIRGLSERAAAEVASAALAAESPRKALEVGELLLRSVKASDQLGQSG